MAPLPAALAFLTSSEPSRNPELDVSPVERDIRNPSSPSTATLIQTRDSPSSVLTPVEAHDLGTRTVDIFQRDATPTFQPGKGSQSPDSFNNSGFFALFAIIGAAMVIASLWFFFWAKNGGFHFQKSDWDDYKSTVLRRKGPDGRTLSNATKSTRLGGSTIAGTQHYKWAKHAARSVVGRDEKGRKGVLGKRGWGNTHSITYSDDDCLTVSLATETVTDEMTELRSEPEPEPDAHHPPHSARYRDRDVQDYKRERPARVGGLNRVADGSHFGGTTDGSELSTAASEQPILKKAKDKTRDKDKDRAERKAREEAAKMERRWKREAEEAAAALARESGRNISVPKRSAVPSKAAPSSRPRARSRDTSPKKRDYSYRTDDPASEVLSTAYTGATSQRSASYYEEYRPNAESNPRYPSDHHGQGKRQSSPKKKSQTPRGGVGGYRRGADSDLD